MLYNNFIMCGIVGVVNQNKPVADDIIFGLKALEYRGYDSAGAIFSKNFEIYKTIDSIETLEKMITHSVDTIGLGHTRWATHGAICLENAHPIVIKNVALVHNGIIENAQMIKNEINYKPKTGTDTEILLALFIHLLKTHEPLKAMEMILKKANGSYAAAILGANSKEILWIKKGLSPLILAKRSNGYMISSDESAVNAQATIFELPRECFGYISSTDHQILGPNAENTPTHIFIGSPELAQKQNGSYLESEIFQQIKIFANYDTNSLFFSNTAADHDKSQQSENASKKDVDFKISNYDFITLIGCGSAYIACTIGRLWFEEIGLKACAEIASEWNCKKWNSQKQATDSKQRSKKNELAIFLSQSGETADTLSALRSAIEQGIHTIAIVNKENSAIAKEAHDIIHLGIGSEKSVASSKAFTAMLLKLHKLAQRSDNFDKNFAINHRLASLAEHAMQINLDHITETLLQAEKIIIVGKHTMHSIACEGALKIQELTYLNIHAFPCGELKHGYIALIDEKTVAIALNPWDRIDPLYSKTLSCIAEIQTRKGKVITIADHLLTKDNIILPEMKPHEAPFIYAIIMQRIALQMAQALNKNIDKPRNLAKAVTVE